MRTTARLFTGTALAVAAIGAFAAPAAYADNEWNSQSNQSNQSHESLEIFPSSASPGETVTVNTLACGKHGHGVGDANSLGAGEFPLSPSTHKEVVVGQFRVPEHVKAGSYWISVACDNGKTARGADGGELVVDLPAAADLHAGRVRLRVVARALVE
ncbi:hypothetical protein AB0F16_10695, partial [Streptomyces tanashiensis]|uniref:hypothetical protein n=1 Tax=Streptomyces tanashiensis TaxID=67367 RepID=UPI00340C57F0